MKPRKSRKLKAVTVIGLLLFVSVLFLLFPTGDLADPSKPHIVLAAPPSEIVAEYLDAPAIATAVTALFGWDDLDDYGTIAGFDIFDSAGVMLNYTDHGDAIDGWVRVWDAGSEYTCSDNNPDDENCYVDVWVRVRSDKTVIGRVFQSQTDSDLERGVAYIYWGHEVFNDGNPTNYSTSIARALEIVTEDGLSITDDGGAFVFDYSEMNYYDYEFTAATRLFIFGYTIEWNSTAGVGDAHVDDQYLYFTVEAGSTIQNTVLSYGGFVRPSTDHAGSRVIIRLFLDGGEVYEKDYQTTCTRESLGWRGEVITSNLTVGVQSTLRIYTYDLVTTSGNACSTPHGAYHNVAVVIWSS